jgi:hypothetical protein
VGWPMTRYAENTSVPVDRSRNEIEKQLQRFGADGFAYGWDGGQEVVSFTYDGKQVRLSIPLPKRESYRSEDAWAKERRRRFRVLVLAVKALLVAVEDGLVGFEEAFLSWFVTPSGSTVGDMVIPQLNEAARTGILPPLMLPAPRGDR